MALNEHYNLLGVDHSVTREALRCAFRKMVLDTHPDHNPDDTFANERTRKLIEAYKAVYRETECKDINSRPRTHGLCELANHKQTKRAFSPMRFFGKFAPTLTVIGILAFTLIQIVHGMLADQALAFEPNYISQAYPTPTPVLAATIAPDPLDTSAWYADKEYQLTLAGRFATNRLMIIYSQAARRAAAHGNNKLAQFYKTTIKNIEDSTRTPFNTQQ